MKTKLLLLFTLITFFSYSQTPIEDYNSAPASVYAVVEPTSETPTSVDQSNSGATSWDFTLSPVVESGTAVTTSDSHSAVTTGSSIEVEYPGTNSALTTTATADPPGNSNIYTKSVGTGAVSVSITGLNSLGLSLNYTDNALIGTFPNSFESTCSNTSDPVSGTFSSADPSATGTFTGTIVTCVDGHGNLKMNDVGVGAYDGTVTRLKITQNLDLTTSGITGTVEQTTYYYYDASNANLVFRSNELNLSVPIFSINETSIVMESLLSSTLGVSDNKISDEFLSIYPNPVKDELNFKLNKDVVINSIIISDISGRQILEKTNVRTLNVNQLNSGLYLVSIKTNKGTLSRKFVKQ